MSKRKHSAPPAGAVAPLRSRYPVRVLVGVGAVGLLGLLGSLNLHLFLQDYSRANADPFQIRAEQERLRPLESLLPPDSIVDYVSDVRSDAGAGAAFLIAQYVLAPRVLIRNAPQHPHALVLGNFYEPVDLARIQKDNRLALVKDFGGGVVLFRRESR